MNWGHSALSSEDREAFIAELEDRVKAQSMALVGQLEEQKLKTSAVHESLWTGYITSDPSPERLERLLAIMLADLQTYPPARAAHVLMLLGRPRDAEALLSGRTDHLSVAQRALALCQIARDEELPHLWQAVAAGPRHFGRVNYDFEIAAQMRLDFALGMAELECGNETRGREHMMMAQSLALMCGNDHMGPSVDSYLMKSEALRDPRRALERLMMLMQDANRMGNRIQVTKTAYQARDMLIRLNALNELPALVAQLPEYLQAGRASWWLQAADALSRPAEALPEELEALTLDDGLLLTTKALCLMRYATRLRSGGHPKDAAEQASRILALPAWKASYDLPHLEAVYQLARAQAHLFLDDPQQASRSLGLLAVDGLHLRGPLQAWYFGVTLAQALSMGATYPANLHPEAVVHAAVQALASLPEAPARDTVLRTMESSPAGVAVLAQQPNAPRALIDAAHAQLAVLGPKGLTLYGNPVVGYPHEHGAAVLESVLRGEKQLEGERQTLMRHRKLLTQRSLPLVLVSERDRALGMLRRGVTPRAPVG